jgi:hypothetical protein
MINASLQSVCLASSLLLQTVGYLYTIITRIPVFFSGNDDIKSPMQNKIVERSRFSSHYDRHGPGSVFKVLHIIGKCQSKRLSFPITLLMLAAAIVKQS